MARFVFLRGELAEAPLASTNLGAFPDLTLATLAAIDKEQIYTALTGPSHSECFPIQFSPLELRGLSLWIALQESLFCELYAEGDTPRRELVPSLLDTPGSMLSTFGLCDLTTLSVLAFADRHSASIEDKPAELLVRTFGPQLALAQQLTSYILAWDRAGRPFVCTAQGHIENLFTKAYQREGFLPPTMQNTMHEIVVEKHWTRFICSWR